MLSPFGSSFTPGLPSSAVLAATATPRKPHATNPVAPKISVRLLQTYGADSDVMTRQAA